MSDHKIIADNFREMAKHGRSDGKILISTDVLTGIADYLDSDGQLQKTQLEKTMQTRKLAGLLCRIVEEVLKRMPDDVLEMPHIQEAIKNMKDLRNELS